MHFVTSQSEHEQITDIITFMVDHMRESLEEVEKTSPAFDDFESKI